MLRVLACYAPDDLPRAVLDGLEDAGEAALDDALEVLSSYGVADRSPDGSQVSVHHQVQAVVVDGLTEDERASGRATAAALLQAALPPEPERPSSWPAYARLLAHVHAVLPPESPAMGSVVDYLHASGTPRTAHALLHRRHAVMHDTLGPEHADTLATRVALAVWMGDAGDAAGGMDQLTVLVPVLERVLGPEHPDTLTSRFHLAFLTGEAGNRADARDQFAALLPVLERVLGPEHPDTVNVRAYLAYWRKYARRSLLTRWLPGR